MCVRACPGLPPSIEEEHDDAVPHGHDPVMSEYLESNETSFTLGPLRLDASVAQTFENRSIESITMVGRHTFGDKYVGL